MNYADRLDAAVERVKTPALIGIDPHLELLPEEFAVARNPEAARDERARAVERFCCELLELVQGRVAAVKPQSAFFEVLGADGVRAFERVVERAHALGLLVIGDVKRNDIASTAKAYASAFLDAGLASCDAITVNPFLGPDTLQPFVEVGREQEAGIYVLVRTSNPGSAAFQLHGEPPLWEQVAREVDRAGRGLVGVSGFSSIGAVVGATHSGELASIREALPKSLFLLPGYGAQGAGARDVAPAFPDPEHPWRGGLVNSSRGIAFAWRRAEHQNRDWKDASNRALDAMIADLDQGLGIGNT